jgi:hypothetical protein
MRKSFWIVLALLVVGGAPYAHADSFNVSGTATSFSGGTTFSGMLTIDVISGTVTAVDITFPGLTSFTNLIGSFGVGTSDWEIDVNQGPKSDILRFFFTTTMTPGSLVGFTGGSISGGTVEDDLGGGIFNITGGSITPTGAPEPSSLALIPLGLGALLLMRRRMGHNSPSAV